MVQKRDNFLLFKYLDEKYQAVHHILFWLAYSLTYFISVTNDPSSLGKYLFFLTLNITLVYSNLYVFLPRFLLKNKFQEYLLYTFLTLLVHIAILTIALCLFFQHDCPENKETWRYVNTIIYNFRNIGALLGTAIGLKLFKVWIVNQRRIRSLENEKLKSELEYLKNQTNPHFLFNTLNNIYVQTKLNHQKASQTILKLSDLLRYQLYECSKDKVYLSSEIEYLQNYLGLERIRKNNANIDFKIEGKLNGLMVPPFLFIPFVENAVKHGLNNSKDSFISIEMEISAKKINFFINNSKIISKSVSDSGGVGLSNAKRRLEILFPDKHYLIIDNSLTSYSVQLTLFL